MKAWNNIVSVDIESRIQIQEKEQLYLAIRGVEGKRHQG